MKPSKPAHKPYFLTQLDHTQIKSRIAMAKATFNNKRALFTNKMDLELRKKLVKC
jgi:hypothetical protein